MRQSHSIGLKMVGAAPSLAMMLLATSAIHAEQSIFSVEATKHMVKECRQQHDNMARTIDELLVEMEQAQRSHDSAKTRAALELIQLRLANLKQEMALCSNLLNMIDRRSEPHGAEHETTQREEGQDVIAK
jgi:hypothetical protein